MVSTAVSRQKKVFKNIQKTLQTSAAHEVAIVAEGLVKVDDRGQLRLHLAHLLRSLLLGCFRRGVQAVLGSVVGVLQ